MTALHDAVEHEGRSIGVVSVLVERGADVNAKNKRGVTPLLSLCQKYQATKDVFEMGEDNSFLGDLVKLHFKIEDRQSFEKRSLEMMSFFLERGGVVPEDQKDVCPNFDKTPPDPS